MYWENDDVGGQDDSNKIAELFEEQFAFSVEKFKIPVRSAKVKTKAAIMIFISEYDEEDDHGNKSLLIFHFAGHGQLQTSGHVLSICGSRLSTVTILWLPLRSAMLDCSVDILIMLDCCQAAAGIRPGSEERTVEVVGAGGEHEIAWGWDDSFTNFFDLGS